MRRSPRLANGAGNGSRSATPTHVPNPQTPQHPRSGAVLDDLVRSLDSEWQLGLSRTNNHLSSPSQPRTLAGRTYSRIQLLFYTSRPALDDALRIFNSTARGCPLEKRLETLYRILLAQPTPVPRSGTPRNVPPKTLLCKLRAHHPLQRKTRCAWITGRSIFCCVTYERKRDVSESKSVESACLEAR